MTGSNGNVTVLRNLANDLLTQEENERLKESLQAYRKSGSLTSLVTQLTKVVTSTEKLMLLVELSGVLPEHLTVDFHKLCCLHFPRYESFLKYFTPSSVGERSRIISKDPTGEFQVVSGKNERSFLTTTLTSDQRSLQCESGIDVTSDLDDISRSGTDPAGGSTWRIESRSGRSSSVSSQVSRSNLQQGMRHRSESSDGQVRRLSQSSMSVNQAQDDVSIRTRARSLRMLSGSLPTGLAQRSAESPSRMDSGRAKILLKRREDGSLGLGIKGGREFNEPISVYNVEPGSHCEMQGLRVGDKILDVNGTDFTTVTHAEAVMMLRNAWNAIMIVQHMDRPGLTHSHGPQSPPPTPNNNEIDVVVYPTRKGKLGCGVLRDEHGHVIVKNVEKNSPASKAGLKKGDHFTEIDGIRVSTLSDKQVSALTNVKRLRLKIYRASAKGKTQNSQQFEFDSMFSPLALDLTPLTRDDSDTATFASSTPRRAIERSQSEERLRPSPQSSSNMAARARSSSMARGLETAGSKKEIIVTAEINHIPKESERADTSHEEDVTDSKPQTTHDSSEVGKATPPADVDIVAAIQSRPLPSPPKENTPPGSPRLSNKELISETDKEQRTDHTRTVPLITQPLYTHTPQQTIQQQHRMYKPRVVNQYSVHHAFNAHHPHPFSSSSKVGRYIAHQPALPSRLAMMYVPSQSHYTHGHVEIHDRSRPKKRSGIGSSASSKMKQIRHRSQSPHALVAGGGAAHGTTNRDREFLRAIQNSVERRQRAHRLSLYQLPGQEDDAWNIV